MPHATISLELSSTGLRVASREESVVPAEARVVVVFLIRCSSGA
jgi:hypothetical protein